MSPTVAVPAFCAVLLQTFLHRFLMKAVCPPFLKRARALVCNESRCTCIGGTMVPACNTSIGVALSAPAGLTILCHGVENFF